MKQYQNPQDNALRDLLQNDDEPQVAEKDDIKKDKAKKLEMIKPPQRKVMTGVDYRHTSLHYNRGVPIDVVKSRVNPKSNYLPAHMQNQAARISLGTG